MSDAVLVVATLGLALAVLGGAVMTVVGFRRQETARPALLLAGAALPILASAGYLVLGAPPYDPTYVLGVGAIGSVLGVASSWATSMRSVAGVILLRQSGWQLTVWAGAYAASAVASLIPRADMQAVCALILAGTAGLAAGAQLGLLARSRSTRAAVVPD